MTRWWKQPLAGDFVWCYFPQDEWLEPGPKPRPGLLLKVRQVLGADAQFAVEVVYGTSQKVESLFPGEFLLDRTEAVAFERGGGVAWRKYAARYACMQQSRTMSGTPAGNSGELQFNASGSFGSSASLYFDTTNTRLGIGTNNPQATLSLGTGGIIRLALVRLSIR
jgi:hypothetical protein